MFEEIEKQLRKNDVYLDTLASLDKETLTHSRRVVKLSHLLGRAAKLTEVDMRNLSLGAMFHDIGKTFIPKEILGKRSKLTDEEFNEIKKHPILGYEFMRDNGKFPESALAIISDHHEKLDGSGYPANKVDKELSKLTKIVTICDIYDAVISDRVYRKGMDPILVEIMFFSDSDKLYDKELVDLFFKKVVPEL